MNRRQRPSGIADEERIAVDEPRHGDTEFVVESQCRQSSDVVANGDVSLDGGKEVANFMFLERVGDLATHTQMFILAFEDEPQGYA